MPRSIVYQLHLLHILDGHRRIDLNLFSHISDCVTFHARERGVDFTADKMFSRNELVKISADVYGLHGMKPQLNQVRLLEGGNVVVPSSDVKTVLLSLLNDKTKMRPENIAANYNIFLARRSSRV